MNKGWISINRKIQNHWLWKDKREFSKLEAWLDILLTVNHTDKKVLIKNTLFTVKRGQSINSQITWGKRWKWNRSKVKRFLFLLQSDSMIELKTNNKTTILTVCKYDSYQDFRTSDEHQMNIKRTSDEHQMNTNNNVNNVNNVLYSEKDFLDNWETLRTKYLKKPTNIKKLDFNERKNFNIVLKEFSKDEINKALFGLFKQENKNIGSMYLKPNHFLENVGKYLNAELSKEYNLYGKSNNNIKKGGL